MIRIGIAASTIILLGGCAHSSLLLLPDEDGGHGSVAVLESGGKPAQAVVAAPNSRTALGQQRAVTRPIGAKGLNRQETALLGGLPPPARTFTLYFQQGKVELSPESRGEVAALRSEVARRPGADVEVTGHTDTMGDGDYNDDLSLKRAEEVLSLLVSAGFDRSLMTAVGRGERELRERTADSVSNARNRRVEVIVR
ncbi:MAG TPA: OmpA family protein [Sphingomicrobium sp.]|nr:OmpA family protein [Sphingomicrobium sp.]